jgi:hypothetical protein
MLRKFGKQGDSKGILECQKCKCRWLNAPLGWTRLIDKTGSSAVQSSAMKVGNSECLSRACNDCKDLCRGGELGRPPHSNLRLLSQEPPGRYASFKCNVCLTILIGALDNVRLRDWIPAPWRLAGE